LRPSARLLSSFMQTKGTVMALKSNQSRFARLPEVDRPRSSFDRSHQHKTTFDAGYLIPIFVDEALPGDTFNLNMTAFARLATPLHPFMDNMYLSSFFFAVPLRLLWNNFQRFMGEQPNPGDSTDFVTPKVTTTSAFAVGSLYDYFGLPTGVANISGINNFPARAYNLVWNEWFRDQNLQDQVTVDLDDGPDDPAAYVPLRRGKRHDYFTSALPWPQKGPVVELPLSGNAPVSGIFIDAGATYADGPGTTQRGPYNSTASGLDILRIGTGDPARMYVQEDPVNAGWPYINADLSDVTAATINQLREAITIQQLYELDARGGTRYIELVLAHFGVRSPDARLQRPEYLGGSTSPVNVSPIAQMSETTVDSPQGNLAAIGTSTMRGRHGFSKSFTEHSIVLGLVCAHADLTYQQGVNRMHSRSTRFDYYWPTLANLGEQAVLNKEIFAQGNSTDLEAFAYQERWSEYRYKPNQISGQFRSSYAQSLDTWHLAQEFGSLPTLSATFIVEDPPVDRVIAVADEVHFIFDSVFNYKCTRAMPVYSVPGLRRL